MVINLNQTTGFVLVTALVFLIALTSVASMLLLNTTTDMKMSGASQERVIAMQQAVSASDDVIQQQTVGNNLFDGNVFPQNVNVGDAQTTATIDRVLVVNDMAECPRAILATSIKGCNILRVQTTRNYGNNNSNSVVVHAGIYQVLLDLPQ